MYIVGGVLTNLKLVVSIPKAVKICTSVKISELQTSANLPEYKMGLSETNLKFTDEENAELAQNSVPIVIFPKKRTV